MAMLEDLARHYQWQSREEMQQLRWNKPEDIFWLWCMHSLWTDCKDLVPTICRPGWWRRTHGERFKRWLSYGPWSDARGEHAGGRADIACFLGPDTAPTHAFFCELAWTARPGAPHKDSGKLAAETALPVWHVLMQGSLSPTALPSRIDHERDPERFGWPRHRISELVVICGRPRR